MVRSAEILEPLLLIMAAGHGVENSLDISNGLGMMMMLARGYPGTLVAADEDRGKRMMVFTF